MRRLALVVLVPCLACARPDASPRAAEETTPQPAPATARLSPEQLRAAEATLAAYLEASREGSATTGERDTLVGCEGGGSYLPVAMLGAYRVLPGSERGDTVVVRAAVATVAEQSEAPREPGRYLARQRLRVDTLEWDVVPEPAGQLERWRVCNGLQFGYYGPDSLTTWRPAGASPATARALADSVRRAWAAASPR